MAGRGRPSTGVCHFGVAGVCFAFCGPKAHNAESARILLCDLARNDTGVFVNRQQIRWVIKVGGWIILVVGVTKAKLFYKMPRDIIFWIMAGEKTAHFKRVEGIINDRNRCLAGVSATPLV